MLGEDLHEGRPTTSMKKGWLYRTSYDKIVYTWWWPTEIQIEWWSRSSYDDSERSRSGDDPDPAVVIQIEWWSRSSPVMLIQIRWWSRSSDAIWWWSRLRDDLKTKMTWRWRWLKDEDVPVDAEKKTSAEKLCRKNTFLVKRECWCICNFGMYSSMYFILL